MSKQDKPQGAKLGWKLLSTSYPVSTRWLRLRRDRVKVHNEKITFTYMVTPGAVGVVPVTRDGEIIMLRQYRYTVDEWSLEVPAGGTHDRKGIPLEEAALGELREELGASCGSLEYVSFFYMSVGNSSQKYHVFLALDVELDKEQATEETELIELRPLPIKDAFDIARAGQITDATSALAILLCENRLRDLGLLES